MPDPIALGTAAGTISLTSEVTIDPDPPAPGQLGLGGVRLRLAVPTDGSAPDVGITLVGLQLPGASAPSDVILDVTALDQLEDRHPALHRSVCHETGAVRRHVNLFVNKSHVRDRDGLDTALAPGDVLTILPTVSGG